MKSFPFTQIVCASLLLLIGISGNAYSQITPPPAPTGSSSGIQQPGTNNIPAAIKIKKHIISFGFFSPINHHISFGYDQIIGEDVIFSGQLGIIGPGINNSNYAYPTSGAFVEAGIKLFFSPDFYMDGLHRYNAMQGGYFKPQIVVSSFGSTSSNYGNGSATSAAVILNLGKQYIIGHVCALDMYAGVGYCIVNNNGNNSVLENGGNMYSYLTLSSIAFTAGVNIGVPF